ncbi:MAG: cysteine desulfurase [Chloroflexi bacterium]|jgi:cysteine desulfurase / selenocysteine lyase|nr:MAG: cysteine desulfurase [Chloroflexota bacterium]
MIKAPFDVATIRSQFPILQLPSELPVAFLDSASSSQKPEAVISALADYYRTTNANVHRGVYQLSEQATFEFERARGLVALLINATHHREVIFTRNTTEAINLVAHAWGGSNLRAGDVILLTQMEHHSNIVPWQLIAQRTGAVLRAIPIDSQGRLVLDDIDTLLQGVKMLAITHQSNVLGTINPIAELTRKAHAVGALILVDGAQSVPHMPVDVQALDIDFLAFSGHKMVGPTGVGVLWGRKALLDAMPPFLGGGSMIKTVTIESSTYADVPARFEAGTPMIGEAIALGAAVTYLMDIGMANIAAYEHQLSAYLIERLDEVPEVTWYGPPVGADRGAMAAFSMTGVHPHDIAQILDGEGVAVRAGHHCTQPLHVALDVPSSVRASCYLYTNTHDIDRLVRGLSKVKQLFG